jgi:hypothetical protein
MACSAGGCWWCSQRLQPTQRAGGLSPLHVIYHVLTLAGVARPAATRALRRCMVKAMVLCVCWLLYSNDPTSFS